jgi:Trypsin-co-occurring domain 1
MPVIRDIVKNDEGQDIAILIEVDDKADEQEELIIGGSYDYGSTRGPLDHAPEAFKKALELAHACAEQVGDVIHKMPKAKRPSGFEVQFAVKIDSEMNALIAKATTGAQLQFTFRWEKDEEQP